MKRGAERNTYSQMYTLKKRKKIIRERLDLLRKVFTTEN